VVCQHTEHPVTFPDGTRVLASGWLQRPRGAPVPDFGLYMDASWQPHWPAVMLEWPDFGVPSDREAADAAIRDAFERARVGQTVEVACVGGHGRTGTVLACMAVLAGVPPAQAVEWVRSTYCRRAVQEPAQQYWVERWAERTRA
jgi:Protein-tyrosine phosphatase